LIHVERTVEASLEAEDKSAFRVKHCYSAHGGARAYQVSKQTTTAKHESGDKTAEAEPDRHAATRENVVATLAGDLGRRRAEWVQLEFIVRLTRKIVVTAKAIQERIAKLRREGKTLPASGLSSFLTIKRRGCDRNMSLLPRR